MRRTLAERPCVWCGKPYLPYHSRQKFDSRACNKASWASNHRALATAREKARRDADPVEARRKETAKRVAKADHYREMRRRWALANPEKVKAYSARWRRDNPEDINRRNRLWAGARSAAWGVPFTEDQFQARMDFYGNACWMCRGPFEAIDHVKPVSKGGGHLLSNLRPACGSCNSRKHNTWLGADWARTLRFNDAP